MVPSGIVTTISKVIIFRELKHPQKVSNNLENINIMIIKDSLAPPAPPSHLLCHLLPPPWFLLSRFVATDTKKCFAKFSRIPIKIEYYILVLHTYPFSDSSWLQKRTQKTYMLTNIIMSICTYIIKLFLIVIVLKFLTLTYLSQ